MSQVGMGSLKEFGIRARQLIRPRGPKQMPQMCARHRLWSVISSADDLRPQPSRELILLAVRAAERAIDIELDDVAVRCRTPLEASWVTQWPGEHYRFLTALAEVTETRCAVEVGTFQGPGALALLAGMPTGKVVTYDLIPWHQIDGALLREEDFGDRLEQRIGDLSEPSYFRAQIGTLREADLLFIDGPKDGVFEQRFLPQLLSELRDRRRLLVIDDIRVLNMVRLWRELRCTKFDATSFGHWSGTGMAFSA
jgi:predicted O-methyltransferase YrrM